ncbi:MAG: hypothetical protein GY715_03000 [Planctomycetes bacterium]|nr:hypothetical protein [Planctomycetota bacterium]
MMIADVLADPRLTLPGALLVVVVVAWYWWRLGRVSVPRSRRLIRRASIVLVLLLLPALVRGLSYLDAEIDGRAFVVAWSVATILVLLILLVACIDALMTIGQERQALGHDLDQRTEGSPGGDAPP